MGGVFARAIDGGRMDAGWADALAPVADDLERLERRLTAEQQAGRAYLPAGDLVLRAFEQPFDAVRVLLLGQDPYPTPGHPLGLAFAVDRGVRSLPRSLGNILRERESDLGIPPSAHGDLSAWSRQGVLLLNRVLTVQPGRPGSHRGWGWETVTARAIEALAGRDAPLVAILWGREAAQTVPLLGATPMILSAHPSPLSAHRGFFGSRPFSRANALLESAGAAPIDWRLDGETGRG